MWHQDSVPWCQAAPSHVAPRLSPLVPSCMLEALVAWHHSSPGKTYPCRGMPIHWGSNPRTHSHACRKRHIPKRHISARVSEGARVLSPDLSKECGQGSLVIRGLITRKFQNTVNVALISVLFSLAAPALLARDLHPGAPAAPVRPNLNAMVPG